MKASLQGNGGVIDPEEEVWQNTATTLKKKKRR
jgi:hypothetical protein